MKTYAQNQKWLVAIAFVATSTLLSGGCSKSAAVSGDSETTSDVSSDSIDTASDTASEIAEDSDTDSATEVNLDEALCGMRPNSLVGVSDDSVYLVGNCGLLIQYNGSSWTDLSTDRRIDFNDGVAFDETNVFFAGSTWTPVRVDENNDCYDVDHDDICFQFSAYIGRLDGDQLRPIVNDLPVNSHFVQILGSAPGNLVAVGNTEEGTNPNLVLKNRSPVFFRFDGTAWENLSDRETPFGDAPSRIGITPSNIWGTYVTSELLMEDYQYTCNIMNFAQDEWSVVHTIDFASCASIVGAPNGDLFVATNNEEVVRFDGLNWISEPLPDGSGNGYRMHVVAQDDIYAVGGNAGILLHRDSTQWTQLSVPSEFADVDFFDIWASPNTLFVLGFRPTPPSNNIGTFLVATVKNGEWIVDYEVEGRR